MAVFVELYARERIAEAQRHAVRREREQAADPRAEVPRTGIGLKHEVFRRIVGDTEPRRTHFWRRVRA